MRTVIDLLRPAIMLPLRANVLGLRRLIGFVSRIVGPRVTAKIHVHIFASVKNVSGENPSRRFCPDGIR